MDAREGAPPGQEEALGAAVLNRAEIIVHNTVYHQLPGAQPSGLVHRYARTPEGAGPPFVLPVLVLAEAWQPLPCGHVGAVGMVVVRNDEGHFPHTIPTDEERDEASRRVVEVAFAPPGYPRGELRRHAQAVHPGCSAAITPVEGDPACAWIRSAHGRAICWLMVLPR